MARVTLSWNEMRDRAFAFVREWKDETSEKAEAQSFWTEWFDIFGLKRRGTIAFERAAKRESTGGRGGSTPSGLSISPSSTSRPAKALSRPSTRRSTTSARLLSPIGLVT